MTLPLLSPDSGEILTRSGAGFMPCSIDMRLRLRATTTVIPSANLIAAGDWRMFRLLPPVKGPEYKLRGRFHMTHRPFAQYLVMMLLLCVLPSTAHSEDSSDSTGAQEPSTALTIFVTGDFGSSDYFRENIHMAEFVRDRKQADVHVLISDQGTGGGGDIYTLEFIGRQQFESLRDTLSLSVTDGATDDEIRSGLVEKINLGLVRFVARTPQVEHLSIAFTPLDTGSESTEIHDPWNRWVFRIRANMWADGEKTSNSISVWGNASAQRVTETTRLRFSAWGSYDRDRWEYDEDVTIDESDNEGGAISAYFAINDHWSWGGFTEASSATYNNWKLMGSMFGSLEYNVFPYSESTRRQLRLTYNVGVRYVDYYEETLYDKIHEWQTRQSLNVSLEMVQPWGEIDITLHGSHYFHDIDFYRVRLRGDLSVSIWEGLSFDWYGSISHIHDQLALKKGSLSKEDVLLERSEQATNYSYYMRVGLSYSFGSIYNNVVNPRFGF